LAKVASDNAIFTAVLVIFTAFGEKLNEGFSLFLSKIATKLAISTVL